MDCICYIETVIQIPGIGKYNIVLLVVKDTAFSQEVPVLVGTNILRNLPQHKRVDTLWRTNIKQCHHLINNIGKVYCVRLTLWGKAEVHAAKFDSDVYSTPSWCFPDVED